MDAQWIHRASGRAALALSSTALLTVLIGTTRAPPPDEGTAAHIFQLAVAALAPTFLIFLTTADWNRPGRSARPLILPVVFLALAFALLYRFEHR